TFAVVAAILLAICAAYAAFTYQRWRAAEDVQATVGVSRDLFDAMQNVRLQRGVIAAAIEAPAALTPTEQGELTGSRAEISLALTSALARLERGGAPNSARLAARLRAGRAQFMAAQKIAERHIGLGQVEGGAAAAAWIDADDRFVATMVGISSEMSNLVHRQDGLLGRLVSISRLAWSTRSAAGDTWIILHRALVQARPLAPEEGMTLAELVGREEGAWDMVEGLGQLSNTPQPLKAAIAKADRLHFMTARARMATLEADLQAGRPGAASGRAWLADGGTSLASLTQVGIVAFDQASLSAQADAQAAERRFFLALGVMLLVAGCSWASSFVMIRRYVGPMAEATDAMRALAAGDLEAAIPCLDRRDEIGQLAQALGVFRENALAKARIEDELRRAEVEKEAAEAASRVKSQFLANMSHEIRTPLNGVLGMVQAMEREDPSPAQRQRLTIIRESGEALLQILGDVLDFSKIEAGKLELSPAPFDLGELARGVCNLFSDIAAAKGLGMHCRVQPAAEGVWQGDAARLRQMLMNLLSNAVKFTSSGSIGLEIRKRASGLQIVVRDTGAGIAPEHLPRLFSKFSQADESITRRFGGTGLGLAICRELTALMGGDV
ncbi:MAG TPA: ATP-binding protein, partial [Caulobacteraceae bacterium]|nr:ATP-binding protein [Caulobacteraceae bacterium]